MTSAADYRLENLPRDDATLNIRTEAMNWSSDEDWNLIQATREGEEKYVYVQQEFWNFLKNRTHDIIGLRALTKDK